MESSLRKSAPIGIMFFLTDSFEIINFCLISLDTPAPMNALNSNNLISLYFASFSSIDLNRSLSRSGKMTKISISGEFVSLLSGLLAKHPAHRISWKDLINHAFWVCVICCSSFQALICISSCHRTKVKYYCILHTHRYLRSQP